MLDQGFLSAAAEMGLNMYITEALQENPNVVNDEDVDCSYSALYMVLLTWT